MAHLFPPITITPLTAFSNNITTKLEELTPCICYKFGAIFIWVGNTLGDNPFKTPSQTQPRKRKKQAHLMEQTLFYTKTTKSMSRYCSNPPHLGQNQETLVNESLNDLKGSRFSSGKRNPSPNMTHKASMPTFGFGNNEEDEIEDDESEFKMGRLIRQASLDSSLIDAPRQINKVMKGSSSLPRYLSQKPESAQEKISNMRKLESMKERNRSKNSMKIVKNNGGAPMIPGGWVDKGSSEDMKAQIKFWARAVAFNVHQEC